MAQKIVLNLVPSIIIEAVKGETYIKGAVDRNSADRADGVAYHETAGDEKVHERKLLRTMYAAVEELKSFLGDYLDTSERTMGDNIASGIDSDNDTLDITLVVSDRFNKSFTDTLAHLASSYIENKMLMLWFTAFNSSQASLYATLLGTDMESMKRCFIKTAPKAPSNKYTGKIETYGDTCFLTVGEEDTIVYGIDEDCVDDVEAHTSSDCVEVKRYGKGKFLVKAIRCGLARVRLYSYHNSDIFKDIKIECEL